MQAALVALDTEPTATTSANFNYCINEHVARNN